jgi:hypothetical protein
MSDFANAPRFRLATNVTREMLLRKKIDPAHVDRLLRGDELVLQDTGMHGTILCLRFADTMLPPGEYQFDLLVNWTEPVNNTIAGE